MKALLAGTYSSIGLLFAALGVILADRQDTRENPASAGLRW
jgi:hypothetical protein